MPLGILAWDNMKTIAFLAILSAFLLSAPLAAAQVDVSIVPESQEAKFGGTVAYELTVTNGESRADSFQMLLSGQKLEWIEHNLILVHLEPGETKSFPITAYVSGDDPGSYTYTIKMQSIKSPSISGSDSFTVTTLSSFGPGNFIVRKVDSRLDLSLEINSYDQPRQISATFTVQGPGFSESAVVEESVDGKAILAASIPLPDPTPPGTYTASYSFSGFTGSEEITVAEVSKLVVVGEDRQEGPLFDVVTMTVQNAGNVPATYTTQEAQASEDLVTGLAIAPECSSGQCQISSGVIEPGQTATLTYRVEHALPFQYAAGALVLVAAGGYGFVHVSRPRVTKKHVSKHGKHSVIIEVKNPMFRKLNSVVVKDFVTPLGHVLHNEFESIKPVAKKGDEGTELVWQLGDIGPRETRLFSSKVKPLMEGTALKMGKAQMKYTNHKGAEATHFSGELVLD